jgi:tRNA(fMet)-specific endonuclease VapC
VAPRTYLHATSIVSKLVRQPQGPITARISTVGEDRVVTSIILACELRHGASKRQSRRLTRQVESVLAAMTILPLERDADRHYGSIRAALERAGTPISAHDLLIAAHAAPSRPSASLRTSSSSGACRI